MKKFISIGICLVATVAFSLVSMANANATLQVQTVDSKAVVSAPTDLTHTVAIPNAAQQTMELSALLDLFLVPEGQIVIAWEAAPSAIYWLSNHFVPTEGEYEQEMGAFKREGEVVLTVAGAATHKILGQDNEAGKWLIKMYGSETGAEMITIDIDNPTSEFDHAVALQNAIKGTSLVLVPIKCTKATELMTSGNILYKISDAENRQGFLNEEWSCGSAGCSLSADIMLTQPNLDQFRCYSEILTH